MIDLFQGLGQVDQRTGSSTDCLLKIDTHSNDYPNSKTCHSIKTIGLGDVYTNHVEDRSPLYLTLTIAPPMCLHCVTEN